MALFGKKKTEVAMPEKAAKAIRVSKPAGIVRGNSHVLISPRITERASVLAAANTFVFNVHAHAKAGDVSKAIREAYKVTPIRVNMVKVLAKKVFVRGKMGVQAGGKKAYVTLAKGDTIDIA